MLYDFKLILSSIEQHYNKSMKTFHSKARSFSQQADLSKRSSESSLSRPLTANNRSPKLYTTQSTPKTTPLLHADLVYNKWFIHPSRRLKQGCQIQQQDKTNDSYIYQELYRQKYPDPDSPFKEKPSEKLKLLEVMPRNNFNYLEMFRRNQMAKRKRVPQIVEMLIGKSKNEGQAQVAR